MRILLVEDEKETAKIIKDELENYYVMDVAHTGAEGDYQAQVNEYDLIILDLVLPDMNGVKLCKNIRECGIKIPILMLTGRDNVEDKVAALDCGADDYLTKPFSFSELLARIRALLRRNHDSLVSNPLSVDDLLLDVVTRTVKRKGVILSLRRKEFDLLEYLMRDSGRVLTRSMILEHVWEEGTDSLTNTVDVHIKHLRDRVDKPFVKKLIKTIHGLGYKLET